MHKYMHMHALLHTHVYICKCIYFVNGAFTDNEKFLLVNIVGC